MYVNTSSAPENINHIIECPGDLYCIHIYYTFSKKRVIMDTAIDRKHILVVRFPEPNASEKQVMEVTDSVLYTLETFLSREEGQYSLNEPLWQLFYDILGFVPFYEKRNNKLIYTPGPEFHSVQEIRNRVRPITYAEFMEIRVPVAILSEMHTLTGIRESIGGFPSSIDFPLHLEPHVDDAITNLCNLNHRVAFMEMLVYDFLGITHIFGTNAPFVIDGDVLVKCNPINLLSIGRFPKDFSCLNELDYQYDIQESIENGEITNIVHVPDTIIECCNPYTKLVSIADAKGELALRGMQLLLVRRGYL